MYKNIFKNKYFLFIIAVIIIMGAETADNSESEINIIFKEGNANVEPLDPDNPIDPGTEPGGTSGSLMLNFISTISFGEQTISAFDKEYSALTKKPYLQLTDLRGSGEGWTVSARASTFENDGVKTLLGSTIQFLYADCISPTIDNAPPKPIIPVVLPTDGVTTVKVVTADVLSGMGTWIIRWYTNTQAEYNDSVILTVPGGSGMLNQSKAVITWSLTNAPT